MNNSSLNNKFFLLLFLASAVKPACVVAGDQGFSRLKSSVVAVGSLFVVGYCGKKIWKPYHTKKSHALQAIAQENGFASSSDRSWTHLGHSRNKQIMRGERLDGVVNERYERVPVPEDQLCAHYKIHLMPKDEDIDSTCGQLMRLIKTNSDLRNVINSFKVLNHYKDTYREVKKGNRHITPRFVIYPAKGKNNTQQALNIIYAHFKSQEGVDIRPRFNARVTSLIYVAQGEASEKKAEVDNPDPLSEYPDLAQSCLPRFELPHRIYYSETVPYEPGHSDHYLRFPGTEKPLTGIE